MGSLGRLCGSAAGGGSPPPAWCLLCDAAASAPMRRALRLRRRPTFSRSNIVSDNAAALCPTAREAEAARSLLLGRPIGSAALDLRAAPHDIVWSGGDGALASSSGKSRWRVRDGESRRFRGGPAGL